MSTQPAAIEIDGSPYSARFFEDEDAHDGTSFASLVVEPPFSFDENSTMLSTILDGQGKFTHTLSTVNKTFLEVRVDDSVIAGYTHEQRIDHARTASTRLIALLNSVENDTFDGTTSKYF